MSTPVESVIALVKGNIGRIVVGKPDAIELLLVALICEGHVLLEDVPGVGKTLLAKALARSLGCSFHRIQFTPDLLPSDVTGSRIFNQKTSEFEFRPGPIFGQLILVDEINRASPRTQAGLLEAMEERQVTADGITISLARPFMVIATQNPVELEGTFPLPEAQLDASFCDFRLVTPAPTRRTPSSCKWAETTRFQTSDPYSTSMTFIGCRRRHPKSTSPMIFADILLRSCVQAATGPKFNSVPVHARASRSIDALARWHCSRDAITFYLMTSKPLALTYSDTALFFRSMPASRAVIPEQC